MSKAGSLVLRRLRVLTTPALVGSADAFSDANDFSTAMAIDVSRNRDISAAILTYIRVTGLQFQHNLTSMLLRVSFEYFLTKVSMPTTGI